MTADLVTEDPPLSEVALDPTAESPSLSEATTLTLDEESPSPANEQSPDDSTLEAPPDNQAPEQALTLADLRPGMQLPGKVVSVTSLGAFIDVGVGRDGLLHLSEIQRAGKEGAIKKGDEIQVWVVNVNRKANRLSLGLEQKASLRELKPGMAIKGRVVRLTQFGAFVDVGAVADGLVHTDEIRRAGQEGKLKVGQELQVFVRSVNRKNNRLSLGLTERTPLSKIRPGTELEGHVTRLADFGAFVDIGATVDGLVHVSQLPGGGPVAEVLSVGERAQVRVESVDQNRRRISLSMKGIKRREAEVVPAETEHFPTAMEIALMEAQERARQKKGRGKRESDRD